MNNILPKFIYGTAWKDPETKKLTLDALQKGFRAIDTANQRKYYNESDVGTGLKEFLNSSLIKRDELFIQTKFTYAHGQNDIKPYSEHDSLSRQVIDSFTSSLQHLNIEYIDSYLLHAPFSVGKITDEDLEVWSSMESLVRKGHIKYLGISNINSRQLSELCKKVIIQPKFVQNFSLTYTAWDEDTRILCKAKDILYQGYGLLKAKIHGKPPLLFSDLAEKYGKTIPQLIYCFCQQLGMICLTGTSNPIHMEQTLSVEDFKIDEVDMLKLTAICR